MLELNWHLPVNDIDALNLKKYLVSNFDQNDISTYGLTFGITNAERKSFNFTSIVIEKNKRPEVISDFQIRDTYNLLYAKNFDPNTLEYIIHVQDVDKVELPGLLMELSKLYFTKLGSTEDEVSRKIIKKKTLKKEIYQCKSCFTVYDVAYGDTTQGFSPGILFEDLPDTYQCSVCEAPKKSFEKRIM